jgi:mannitol-1-/sugar-/sorbitol-6-phosphatase
MTITILGLAAAILTTGSWSPQVIRTLRTRSATDLSWLYLFGFALGTLAWLIYGVVRPDVPIIVANSVTFASVAALCATKARLDVTGLHVGAPASAATDGTADAVLFDMDGTLVDSDAVVRRSWAAWASKHGIDLVHTLLVSPGKPGAQAMAELAPHLTDAEIAADAAELLRCEMSDLSGVKPAAGAAELVEKVQASGVGWAVVTSASRELATSRLKACGLPVPRVLVTCDDVETGKPHPEGYLRAAALLGVEPSRCLVIEDSDAGIKAGLAAGMTVIGTGPRASALQAGQRAGKALRWASDLTQLRLVPARHPDGRPMLRVT